MKILNIEIPPTLNCNQNQVIINGKQIQNSTYQIGVLNGKAQVTFKFQMELTPTQYSELGCVTKSAMSSLKCSTTISVSDMPGASGDIKAQLSYDGTNYILIGFV